MLVLKLPGIQMTFFFVFDKNEALASEQKRKIQLETESIENKKLKVCQKVIAQY